MKKIFLILFLLLSLSLFCEIVSGKVIAVKDGDTIEILYKGAPLKIRLYAVDCPEKDQDFGTKAKQFTSELVFNKVVKVDIKNKDMYGRSVSEVFLPDGRSLNKELLKNGYAWHYKDYNKDESLAELENQAREKKAGLWQNQHAQAPWEFRKGKKNGTSVKQVNTPTSTLKSGAYIASSNSKKFHRSNCKWAKKIPKNNRVYFNKTIDARNQGYEACKDCRP